MKIKQITETSTTAGSIAPVQGVLGSTQTRGNPSIYGGKKVGNLFKGKTTSKPYANSLNEAAMKDLSYDLEVMKPAEFQKKYGKSREEVKAALSRQPKPAQPTTPPINEADLSEHDLIMVPGQGKKLKPGFISKADDRTDHEVEMARSDLFQSAKNAKKVYSMIKDVGEDEGLEGWVQEKIIKANDYLNTVREYLEGKQTQGVAEGSEGNWYIRVNGKILNDTKFKPVIFSSEDEARSHAMKLADKKRIPLSQMKLTKSWMDAPEQGVAEAGPFSYGSKAPRKGSVADLAAKKHKEQQKGKQPVEPKDQMVGVAKVITKGVAEGLEQEYLSQIPNLTWKPVSRNVWNTIQDEGLDEEQDAPSHTDWAMASLSIDAKDAQALMAFENDAIEDFNRFDIHLKSRYPGLTDLIDYDRGTVTIVKPINKQGVAEGDYSDGSSIKTPGANEWKQQYQQAVMAVKNAKTQQEYEAASDRAGRIKDLLASKGIQVGPVLGVAEGSEDLVQIEYWQQETMESGRWVKTKPIPRATAEKIVNSFERGEIVNVEQGVAEGSGGNWYIRVNGKILNDTKFKPMIFSSEDEARSYAMKLADKKRIPLSQIKLTKSWMDAPEQGVAEGKRNLKCVCKTHGTMQCPVHTPKDIEVIENKKNKKA